MMLAVAEIAASGRDHRARPSHVIAFDVIRGRLGRVGPSSIAACRALCTRCAAHNRVGPVPGFLNFSNRDMLCAPDRDPIEALVTLSHDTCDNTGFVLALLPPFPTSSFVFLILICEPKDSRK